MRFFFFLFILFVLLRFILSNTKRQTASCIEYHVLMGENSSERHFIRGFMIRGLKQSAQPRRQSQKETVTVKNICNFSHDSIDKAERKPRPERGWPGYERRDYFRLGCSLKGS